MIEEEDRIEWIGAQCEVDAGSELSDLRGARFFK